MLSRAQAQVSDNVVKIGVLTDLSGPASDATGQGSVIAAQMAVEDFGGKVAGAPIEVVSANHQLKPDIGSEIATRWYDVDKVDLILDVPISAVGLAVQEVARKKQKLLIVHSTGTADFTGKFCSPYGMQLAFDTYALATGTAREVVKRGGDSWYFITPNYAFGEATQRDTTRFVQAAGGKVLGTPVEIVVADHQNKPEVALAIAREWFAGDVGMAIGFDNSAVALAVSQLAAERNRIAIAGAVGSAAFTGKSCTRTEAAWVYDSYSLTSGLAKSMLGEGRDSWYFITEDFEFGHALEADASSAV